ncbi:MAG: YebC/PmpR family DNA-binding transcriptional regulator [bacterium (Candidatus Ratteibacteria) CG_4_10_14_3_um_filter_41_18]|uniref:Probable transcriptional regulatory protein COS11_07285 n=4 Tax=Candidatus Ratteibacteria TaxID=2979319 RepID=A0A2M7E6X5_9BACT|nr:MAG: transcriptional regulator [Candidatus Omnitrophica bacterium CG1_02_41_171]PIV63463.1 MAG: YebC/PmpR family DNA-binding transcriptional regulator [bacterium (Candidatus Ratteibacteria) CG01_land_8_20_14_3_00_40_19]PIW34091.1 MAG: YebC/PmpR family DNA-binding transcriptional regulator [bacterium (Candidatus Ratteibacteria) CG15_BIG_FIL_POST_REV_8_21_14_020_41_12]PIW73973.1 MAG: YebC/PmpR family DNA-binding transcriptional regulator [bacterium (Candidatus Ratteibacteria) CG_4_8_14_3_um_fil
MSGHSKWATIKYKKALTDAKRGKAFTKLIREIMMAAKLGGDNPENNAALRLAIEKAKDLNMPADNIKRAIAKGAGGPGSNALERVFYEGYGPAGVAIMLEGLTDNRQRATSEIRHIFSKYNGNLGENGCVGWLFERKGTLRIGKQEINEDSLFSLILEAGAEDLKTEKDEYEIIAKPKDLEKVKKFLKEKGVKINASSLTMIPKSTVKVEGKDAENFLKLIDDLEDDEDVQNVYSNFDIADEVIEAITAK